MAKMHKCDCLFVIFVVQYYNCRGTIEYNESKKKLDWKNIYKNTVRAPLYSALDYKPLLNTNHT